MLHDFVDIPAQRPELQEILWKRQDLARRIGQAAVRVCSSTKEYNELIAQLIQVNDEIRREENH